MRHKCKNNLWDWSPERWGFVCLECNRFFPKKINMNIKEVLGMNTVLRRKIRYALRIFKDKVKVKIYIKGA